MSKRIDTTVHPSDWEPMKYWAMSSTLSAAAKREKLAALVESGKYLYSQKVDGDLGRFVWAGEDSILQSRTVSKKTGTYGDLTGKVLFTENLAEAFDDTTVLLGEIYAPGGTAKEAGIILRCLGPKALERQKENPLRYYIFDILMFNGLDLTQTPMVERIKYLKEACEKINSPLVSYAKYYRATEDTFYDRLENIFSGGGEGVVLYKESMLPCEGRTSAWETVKIKRELETEADCFITGIEPPKQDYMGKELVSWQYWENLKTLEKLEGNHYPEFYNGNILRPITKSYFYGWPGSVICSVFMNDGSELPLCKCSNLTEELMENLKNNFEYYNHRPVKVGGMSISTDKNGMFSIRHPRLLEVRDDIDIKDCTLSKVLGETNELC